MTDAFASLLDNAAPTVVPAPALVHFQVSGASSAVALKGSLAPLAYDAPLPLSSGEGSVNLGGTTGELFFKFTDTGGDEFAPGKDRVWTLGGAAESIPALTWNTAYGASHGFTLVFSPVGGTPLQIRGDANELGQWGTSPGPAPGSVVFSPPHDFTASPLHFKAWYGPGSTDYEAGTDHTLDDDVLNTRALNWTAGDSSSF
jgi:hypothetical protein